MTRFTLFSALAATLTLATTEASANKLVVDDVADVLVKDADCTLREAIEEAGRTSGITIYKECGLPSIGGPDQIVFDPTIAGGAIVLGSTLVIDGDAGTKIDGVGTNMLIDGLGLTTTSVIVVEASDVTITGLDISGGYDGVTVLSSAANATIGGYGPAQGNVHRDALNVGVYLFGPNDRGADGARRQLRRLPHRGRGVGLHVAPGGTVAFGSTGNCFVGNSVGVLDETGSNVELQNSWWGDSTGPAGVGGGLGDPLLEVDPTGATLYLPVLAFAPPVCW